MDDRVLEPHHEARIADVTAALQTGERDRALRLAVAALEEGVDHPLLLNLRAWGHERAGRFAEALTDLEHARDIAPDDIPILNALALAYQRARRWRESAVLFARVAAAAPDFLPAHLNLGWTYEHMGELKQAGGAYEAALALKSDEPIALGALASLAARRGDWAEARLFATRALAVQPQQTAGLYALALAEAAEGAPEKALAMVERHAEDAQRPILDRALLAGAAGDAAHAQGDPDRAFTHYTRAAALLAQGHAPSFAQPDQESVCAYVRRMTIYLEQTAPEEFARPQPPLLAIPGTPRQHNFILGFPRSGTTLLENVMGAHPEVRTSEEREGFAFPMRTYMMWADGLSYLFREDAERLQVCRKTYWAQIHDQGVDTSGAIFIDKHPLNALKLPLIARLFPEARILFAVRDPRDVVLSCFRRRFAMNAAMYEFTGLERAALFYDAAMTYVAAARPRLALNLVYLKYEDFIADFEGQAFEMCKFFNIPWTQDVQNFAARARGRAIATPSAAQVGRGIYQEGAGQWRAYAKHLAPIMPILRPWIERFGYTPD